MTNLDLIRQSYNENACGMPQSGQRKGSDIVKLAELEHLFG